MPARAFGIRVLTGRPKRFTIENKSHLGLDLTTTIPCRKYCIYLYEYELKRRP